MVKLLALYVAFHCKLRNLFVDMNIINIVLWSDSCKTTCAYMCLWCCSYVQNKEVMYVNYWLEFSQCKLIGQFKPGMKVTRSGDLGIRMVGKCYQTVGNCKNCLLITSTFDTNHECYKLCVFTSHAYQLYLVMPHIY